MATEASVETILVVDDQPENIDVIVGLLKSHYKVKAARSGEGALKIAFSDNPPDLILLDVMMPEMDGYEVCAQLMINASTQDIPVIFVTALGGDDDETKGFEMGAVDFVTKPISPPTLLARVNTHIELQRAKRGVEKTLSETLSGSVAVLTEILAMANPTAFGRGVRMRKLVRFIVQKLERKDAWQFELAAMLCQVGCVTVPAEVLKKIYQGVFVSEEEMKLFEKHPQTGARLLAKIPRLETVVSMVADQNHPKGAPFNDDPRVRPADVLGPQILKIVLDFEKDMVQGITPQASIQAMEGRKRNYDPTLVAVLSKAVKIKKVEKQIMAAHLEPGMTFAKDVYADSGELILNKGTEVTAPVLKMIQELNSAKGVRQPLVVLVPST